MDSHPTLLDFSTSELFNNPCLSLQSYRERHVECGTCYGLSVFHSNSEVKAQTPKERVTEDEVLGRERRHGWEL